MKFPREILGKMRFRSAPFSERTPLRLFCCGFFTVPDGFVTYLLGCEISHIPIAKYNAARDEYQ
jgi:hypothetical protein